MLNRDNQIKKLACKLTLPDILGGVLNIMTSENSFAFFINLDGGR